MGTNRRKERKGEPTKPEKTASSRSRLSAKLILALVCLAISLIVSANWLLRAKDTRDVVADALRAHGITVGYIAKVSAPPKKSDADTMPPRDSYLGFTVRDADGQLNDRLTKMLDNPEATAAVADYIGELPPIRRMYINGATLNSPLWDRLSSLDSIQTLELANIQCDEPLFARLAKFKSLIRLELRNCQISPLVASATIDALSHLRVLLLWDCEVSDDVLRMAAQFPRLQELHIGGSSSLTNAGLRVLSSHPQLRDITLAGVGLSDEALDELRTLKNLKHLSLLDTRISETAIAALRRARPDMEVYVLNAAGSKSP